MPRVLRFHCGLQRCPRLGRLWRLCGLRGVSGTGFGFGRRACGDTAAQEVLAESECRTGEFLSALTAVDSLAAFPSAVLLPRAVVVSIATIRERHPCSVELIQSKPSNQRACRQRHTNSLLESTNPIWECECSQYFASSVTPRPPYETMFVPADPG